MIAYNTDHRVYKMRNFSSRSFSNDLKFDRETISWSFKIVCKSFYPLK